MLRQIVEASNASNSAVWVAAITAMSGVLIAVLPLLIMQRRQSEQVRQISNAVNHTEGTGKPRMYDMVQDIAAQVKIIEHATSGLIEWQESYDGSPFTDAEAINKFVDNVEQRFDELDAAIKSHIEWEESTKYTELEGLMSQLEIALRAYHQEARHEPSNR